MAQLDFHKLLDKTYNHIWNGRNRLALSNAKILFKNNPENSEASVVLAWALLENGYPIKALEYADLALQLNGSSIKSKMVRALILLQLNILEGATDDFKSSIKNQSRLLGKSFIQYAKAEASKGELYKALKLAEKATNVNSHLKTEVKELSNLLHVAIELKSEKKKITKMNLQTYFNWGTAALKSKDVWFVNILSSQILSDNKLAEFHSDAELINLEGLLHSYQFKPAFAKADELKKRFSKNEQFRTLYERLIRKKEAQENIAIELERELSPAPNKRIDEEKRTDHTFFSNKIMDVFSLKIFNQTEEEARGKRTYYQQLNPKQLNKIGLEIIFENFEFEKSENDYDALVIWYLDDHEVLKNNFKLHVPKDWDTVIFTQAGEVNWGHGQAKAEIYIENFKVCEKWFYLDAESIILEQPSKKSSSLPMSSAQSTEEEKIAETVHSEAPPMRSIEELLEELNGYVGLKSVKYAVKEFIDYLEFQKDRESKGLHHGEGFSINAIFEGNPGTGKTTVARLMGEIFYAMGIIKKGHVVEVDRSSLVGQYVGETAQKTDKLIQDAMGGILFIDEAYTLVKKGSSSQDFGQEAIDILLKRMEDNKGDFVVIAAGYPKEMQTFVESNPGLKSRFSHTFTFDDYNPDELLEIFSNTINKEEYIIAEDAERELKKEFIRLYRKRDSSFGNARLAMQIFEKLKIKISKRLVKIADKDKSKEMLSTFTIKDIDSILKSEDTYEVRLPIDQEALSIALSELNNLFGLQSIKNEVDDLVKLVKYFIKQGVNVRDKFGDHILFLGNPGTGKTTVARIISNIYSALGILPSGQLIEVDRSGLVGSHVGETAQKTTHVIDSAMGGTLFIDEAYALTSSNSSSDFGNEAVDTLLKRMEDDRGKFLVIAAGYTNEMKKFISSNPGMKSRFSKTFYFEDYTPEELMKITNFSVSNLKLELTEEAKDALFKHFSILHFRRDKHFGNARIVRNLLEDIKKKQLLRVADEANKEDTNKIILQDIEEFLEKEKVAHKFETPKEDRVKIILSNLDQLVGHKNIKSQILKQIKLLQVTKLRAERGLKFMNKNLNSLFIGNSGSGKSTIAIYLGKIYKELNYLKSGHVVEVKGSELLVADSEQAQNKIEAYVNQALDGILFLENLSPLFENNQLGELVLNNLSNLYDKYVGRLVVIISGSREIMEMFTFKRNSIKLQFKEILIFDDYTPRELLSITANLAIDNNYILDEGALQIILDLYLQAIKIDEINYHNIRLAEQVLFKAISNQEERISVHYNLEDEFLTTIIYDDVASIQLEEL